MEMIIISFLMNFIGFYFLFTFINQQKEPTGFEIKYLLLFVWFMVSVAFALTGGFYLA